MMAKKTRRQVRREVNQEAEKPADPLAMNRPSGFNPDYHYVINDLRRVGILAGSFIIVLVALAIFLH
jgi:hypothetical protein